MGDITWIQNHKTGGGIQTQNFTYDALDRLTSSNATGGTGGTYATETYYYSLATGNMASKAGVVYAYNDPEHTHAVTHLDGVQKYWYDANGSMIQRVVDGNTYNLAYDAESRLVSVSGATSASFVYDGDGNRVKGMVNGTIVVYIGNYFEWKGAVSTSTRYYYAGTQRIAMRVGNSQDTTGLFWITSDHLGSTLSGVRIQRGMLLKYIFNVINSTSST